MGGKSAKAKNNIVSIREADNLLKTRILLKALVDYSPAVMFLKDINGKYVHVNSRFLECFGLEEKNIIGKKDIEVFPESQAELFARNDRQVLDTGNTIEFEETAQYTDGEHISTVLKFPVYDPDGNIIGLGGIATDVTALKYAGQALQASEEHFRLLVESIKDYAIFMLDADGYITTWNSGAENLYGYRDEEIIGKHFPVFFLPEDRDKNEPRLELESTRNKGNMQTQGWRVRKDGACFWADIAITTLFNDNNELLGFAKITRDLTEQKRLETSLRESEAKLRLFIEHAPSAIAMLDRDMRYIAHSRRWLVDYELGNRNIIGLSHYDLFPDLPERWKAIHQCCLNGATEKCDEDKFIRASGDVEWNRWEIVPWKSETGEIGGIIIFSEVITERKQAELALQETEKRFSLMADSAPVLIWMTDKAGDRTYFNQGWFNYTGKTPDQEMGAGWMEGLHPDDRKVFLQTFGEALEHRKPYSMEKRLLHFDGVYRWLLDTGVPRYTDDGTFAGYIGTCIDITERKMAEDDLRDTSEQLRNFASRLQTIREEERANIAREIHDVLAQELTRLKIDIVRTSKWLGKQVDKSAMGMLVNKIQEMTSHVDMAINTVQKIATELRPVILDRVGLASAIEWQVGEFGRNTDIPCQVSVPEEAVNISHEQATAIFRILQESLTNIIRHANATSVNVRLLKDRGYIVLEVEDNGSGIETFRLNDQNSLGLLGMRERAMAFGGITHIDSNHGSGTKIIVRMPMVLKI